MKGFTEAVARKCSAEKENTCARASFLIKLQGVFFYRTYLVAASGLRYFQLGLLE